MREIDPVLREATAEQLVHRRELLSAGPNTLGWKFGVGERESIGGSIAVGYLTSATHWECAGDGPASTMRSAQQET